MNALPAMLGARPPAPLGRILARRMALGAVLVALALTATTFAKYMLETKYLRRETLEDQASAIVRALTEHRNPARLAQFVLYPRDYGFRVFDHRLARDRHVVVAANIGLLPPIPTDANGHQAALEEKFEVFGNPGHRLWQLTEREEVGTRHYWVQVAMRGDPDWRWRAVIGGEMMDHVVIPMATLVPILTLVMLLTTRSALRPLGQIAEQARRMGGAAAAGQTLEPLPLAGLPRELASVVAALNQMLGRLEQSIAIQKQFTADVAHELRTPLAVLLLEAAALPAGPERARLSEELRGLGTLVNELLRFAQAEDALAMGRAPVDIAATARKACEDLAPEALRRGLSIELDTPEETGPAPLVPGNAALVEIAIRNLIENALKFSPVGGTVSVAVAADGAVSVADRGPGLPEAQKSRAFQRFWRADRASGGGAGGGLALVRRVAQLHGGQARLEDREGGGTRAVLAWQGMELLDTSC
ncbi:MAG: HAMP domain-containing protein [Rhodospirillales bacterium]|nr:HAMP domain-containing protein [Rhodospirillales bacterium]